MSAPGSAIVSLDAMPARPYYEGTDVDWLAVRHELGIGAFGINAWRASGPGQPLIESHDESDPPVEEAYLVVRGEAAFWVGGERIDAPAGTIVRVAPDRRREARSAAAGTIVLAIGAPIDQSNLPSRWEARALEENPPRA